MPESKTSEFQDSALRTLRPYLIVGDGAAAIDFYLEVFDGEVIERHTTPSGGLGHAKIRVGDTIFELGEHPDAAGREAEPLPRIGLRLYVADVDGCYDRAVARGATGATPADRPDQGVRGATVYDPFGLTWWLATPAE